MLRKGQVGFINSTFSKQAYTVKQEFLDDEMWRLVFIRSFQQALAHIAE